MPERACACPLPAWLTGSGGGTKKEESTRRTLDLFIRLVLLDVDRFHVGRFQLDAVCGIHS